MSKIINVGLSSFGMSSLVFHGPLLQTNPGFFISKILERTKDISRKHYPKATIVRDFDEIINDRTIDLVVVNTPDDSHYEYTKKAIEAGKHIVV
ncbi:oxidoreductase, partial [Candidatus Peregrinibacteria bacterium]|nr:oxidoreductase [Candidatus Peregrinibacteria bacterium]